jgi:hypothetical protein
MSKLAALFLTVLASAGSAMAEVRAKILAGVVSDSSGGVIANARIGLIEGADSAPKRYTRTDATGHYHFSAVEAPSINLQVVKDGKVPDKLTFTTKSNKDGVLIIDIVAE